MLDFYNIRRRELANVKPNAAHLAIADLQNKYDVNVITQNVDNLHERAGSSKVLHLHGELTKVRPENCCNEGDGFSEASVFDIGYGEIHLGDLAPNGHQLRPHIVWFGEPVPKIERAIDLVSEADILLIVGTSIAMLRLRHRYILSTRAMSMSETSGLSTFTRRPPTEWRFSRKI